MTPAAEVDVKIIKRSAFLKNASLKEKNAPPFVSLVNILHVIIGVSVEEFLFIYFF